MEISVTNFGNFMRSTSAHGFPRIVESPSLPIKVMWMTFLLTSMAGFGYHISQLIINYISVPISANISPDSIPFEAPDISVCSVSPISYSNFYETQTKNPVLYSQLLATSNALAYLTTFTMKYGFNQELLLQVSRDTYAKLILLRYLGHRKEDFIARCRYKGQVCTFNDFTTFYSSTYANCFLFRPSDELAKKTAHIKDFNLDLILFTDTNPISINNFTVDIYKVPSAAATFEGDNDVTKSGGVILYYGYRNQYPRSFINLSPGLHSYVQFDMMDFKFVNRDSKPCSENVTQVYFEDSSGTRLAFNRNRADCQHRKLLEMIMDKCKCLSTRIAPWYYTMTENFEHIVKCQYLNATTNRTEFDTRRNCENDLFTRRSVLFNSMDCQPNCHDRIYSPLISMTSWPLKPLANFCKDAVVNEAISNLVSNNYSVPDAYLFLRDNLTSENMDLFSTNFAQISISSHKSFATTVEEVLSYQFFDLFSDIGGILGLYLGVSLLTVCELFELVLVAIGECREAHKARKTWKDVLVKGNRFQGKANKNKQSTKITQVKPLETITTVTKFTENK